ncbi:arabinofuranosidase catalytic domain-containing protein [Streptomyces monashensis]|nr:arabinofuranosidase catalytic domain-containing protein [Streptomyces monashensis]
MGNGDGRCKPGGANPSAGTFHEGAVVAGDPSDATHREVRVDVTADCH